MQQNLSPTTPGSFAVQAAIIWAAIKHESNAVTLEAVKRWIKEHLKAKKHIALLTAPVVAHIVESGALGFVHTVAEPEPTAKDGEEGKGEEAAPPASIPAAE
jgi:hypothetical protein